MNDLDCQILCGNKEDVNTELHMFVYLMTMRRQLWIRIF
jgi:hypothetical protein